MSYGRLFVLFLLGFLCLGIRLFVPYCGIEPIAGFLLFSMRFFSWRTAFLCVAIQVLLFDYLICGVGVWTLGVVIAYTLIAFLFFYLRERLSSLLYLFGITIAATLLFDALTGLTLGPIFFGQPFMQALIGQIPFTCRHVIGNCVVVLGCIVIGQAIALLKTKNRVGVSYIIKKDEISI